MVSKLFFVIHADFSEIDFSNTIKRTVSIFEFVINSMESRLRVFENRILRRIFGPKRDENGSVEGFTVRNFIVFTVHLI